MIFIIIITITNHIYSIDVVSIGKFYLVWSSLV